MTQWEPIRYPETFSATTRNEVTLFSPGLELGEGNLNLT
jgi:hypothetical protein